MTKEQKAIIIGTVLGDSYIALSKSGKTHIEIKQADRYKEYVFWLYNNLKYLFPVSLPKQRKDNDQWYVNSSFSNDLNEFHKLFYDEGRKIIP